MTKTNSNNINQIHKFCYECDGNGYVSSCCQATMYDGKCSICGKFTKQDFCTECGGEGEIVYKIGSKVEIFICIHSNEKLKETFYKPKKESDVKIFKGTIIEIVDDINVMVKVKYKGVYKLNIEDIELI